LQLCPRIVAYLINLTQSIQTGLSNVFPCLADERNGEIPNLLHMTAPVGAGSKTALDDLLMQQMTKLRRILQNAGRRPAHPGSLLCLRTLKSTINKKLLQNW
jgi:hypothetical protein